MKNKSILLAIALFSMARFKLSGNAQSKDKPFFANWMQQITAELDRCKKNAPSENGQQECIDRYQRDEKTARTLNEADNLPIGIKTILSKYDECCDKASEKENCFELINNLNRKNELKERLQAQLNDPLTKMRRFFGSDRVTYHADEEKEIESTWRIYFDGSMEMRTLKKTLMLKENSLDYYQMCQQKLTQQSKDKCLKLYRNWLDLVTKTEIYSGYYANIARIKKEYQHLGQPANPAYFNKYF
jgi:hypothetical protein